MVQVLSRWHELEVVPLRRAVLELRAQQFRLRLRLAVRDHKDIALDRVQPQPRRCLSFAKDWRERTRQYRKRECAWVPNLHWETQRLNIVQQLGAQSMPNILYDALRGIAYAANTSVSGSKNCDLSCTKLSM